MSVRSPISRPIPNASRIGNIIVSGLIRGADPATAKLAATLEQQCAFMFLHMRQAVEAGGATVEDIIKVTVWMKELQRKPVNDEWVKMFPDPASRPARQIMEVPMEAGVLVQCDFMAVIEFGENEFRDHAFQPRRAGRALHARAICSCWRTRSRRAPRWIRSGAAMRCS